tara:strand:- start:147 stop:323 length:177 start_codon:yes stop_codon:yes gene_type:complete
MTTAVLSLTHGIGHVGMNTFAKLNRWFMLIGYSRAYGELRRLGYYKEADHILKEMKSL